VILPSAFTRNLPVGSTLDTLDEVPTLDDVTTLEDEPTLLGALDELGELDLTLEDVATDDAAHPFTTP
jgi:hypothetical protein